MSLVKQQLLQIALAVGEAAQDLATVPENAAEIARSVSYALERLRRLLPSRSYSEDRVSILQALTVAKALLTASRDAASEVEVVYDRFGAPKGIMRVLNDGIAQAEKLDLSVADGCLQQLQLEVVKRGRTARAPMAHIQPKATVKPYYEHAGITFYHGDRREILPHLEPVDVLCTDPPQKVSPSSRIQNRPGDGFGGSVCRRRWRSVSDHRDRAKR